MTHAPLQIPQKPHFVVLELMVYRMGLRLRTRSGFARLSVLLVLALVMPYARTAWVCETAVIVVFFPFLIALGAVQWLRQG